MTTIHKVLDPTDEDFSPFRDDDPRANHYVVAVKGAPDVVLGLCTHYEKYNDTEAAMTEDVRKRVLMANDEMAAQALRVLGVAYKVVKDLPAEITPAEIEKDLIFAGLIGMIDPARPEVGEALARAKSAGIRTVMITGDYPQTARGIAQTIGLLQPGHKVLTGADINKISDEDLAELIEETDVFARVSPEHKVRIVRALRSRGQVVP